MIVRSYRLVFEKNRSWCLRWTGPWWDAPEEPEFCRLILHDNAQHQQATCIAAMLTEIIGSLTEIRALIAAQLALTRGRAVVLTCPRAVAEGYREQLVTQYQLQVSLEVA